MRGRPWSRAAGVLARLRGCREDSRPVGVVVLAMGRSGTSAVARVINLLGVPLGREDDLLEPNPGNPRGYWESEALLRFQDDLLARHGGSWYAPPDLPGEWDVQGRHAADAARAREVFADVYGERETWVWKDPRAASLFPFWAAVLDARLLLVIPYRHPLAVAASLEARDGLATAHSVALWERYNRLVLAAARGRPAYVVAYDELMRQPVRVAHGLQAWLGACGVPGLRVDEEAIGAFVDPALGARRGPPAADDALSAPQRALLLTLDGLRGPHRRLPEVVLPPETPSTAASIERWRQEHGTAEPAAPPS